MIYDIIMEYQKIINSLGDTRQQPSKFRTRNWVEENDKWGGTYNANSDIKSKTDKVKIMWL